MARSIRGAWRRVPLHLLRRSPARSFTAGLLGWQVAACLFLARRHVGLPEVMDDWLAMAASALAFICGWGYHISFVALHGEHGQAPHWIWAPEDATPDPQATSEPRH